RMRSPAAVRSRCSCGVARTFVGREGEAGGAAARGAAARDRNGMFRGLSMPKPGPVGPAPPPVSRDVNPRGVTTPLRGGSILGTVLSMRRALLPVLLTLSFAAPTSGCDSPAPPPESGAPTSASAAPVPSGLAQVAPGMGEHPVTPGPGDHPSQ